MKINFDSIKSDLLIENNFNTFISAMEFFISLDFKDVSLKREKDVENESAISIVDKLESNNFDFDLVDIRIMIKALETLQMYIFEDFKSLSHNLDFEPPDDICIFCLQKILQLLGGILNDNGFDYKTRLISST